jgi:hypothetical protein
MKKTPGKDHRGVSRTTAENHTKKTGRDDSFKANKPKRGVDNTQSPNPVVRAGRDSGLGDNHSVHSRSKVKELDTNRPDDGIASA